MKNKNLVIKFKGEFEIMHDENDAYFIDGGKERHDLGDYMRVQKDGEFKSFDGVHGLTAFSFYLVKFNRSQDGVKFFYGYTRG